MEDEKTPQGVAAQKEEKQANITANTSVSKMIVIPEYYLAYAFDENSQEMVYVGMLSLDEEDERIVYKFFVCDFERLNKRHSLNLDSGKFYLEHLFLVPKCKALGEPRFEIKLIGESVNKFSRYI